MKIIGPQMAGTILVLPLDDVRPLQGITPQQIIDVLAPRYKFAVRPRTPTGPIGRLPYTATVNPGAAGSIQMLFQMPLTLQNGTAEIGEQKIIIPRLDIMPDVSRIIVQTVSTEEGDIILDDLIPVLEGSCGFRNLRGLATRQYQSNIITQFEQGFDDYMDLVKEIQQIISPALKEATGIDQEAKIDRIGFAFDPTLIPASKAQQQFANFIFERRVEHPFSENRYFSTAPLRTPDHIRVLEQIGALLERKN